MTGQMWLDIIVGIGIIIGLVGAVVQIIPGGLLVGFAVIVWGVMTGGTLGWAVAAFALLLTAIGAVMKFAIAGRYLKERGIPNRSLVVGAALGVIGFFAIPFFGLFIGFIGGTFLAEWRRLRDLGPAWQATVSALKATGIAIIVELGTSLLVTVTWLGALVVLHL